MVLLWATGCLSTGHLLLGRLLRRRAPVREHLVMAFAVGVFSFFALMFLTGIAGLYGKVLFVLLPPAMLAAGALPSWRYARRLARHVRHARDRSAWRLRWWHLLAAGYGAVCLAAIYLQVMLPENASFDARWYHLPIAEHYAASGGIVPFREGWVSGAQPHLASVLYAWAFQMPLSNLFDRVELCAHMEFALFLATIFAIPALVRRLLPRARAGWAWLSVFLFPGLFLYDSSLTIAADHVAAFWAVPAYLALLHAWRDLEPRRAFVAGALIAAILDTKSTALLLAAAPIIAIAGRAGYLAVQSLFARAGRTRPPWAIGLAAFAGSGLLCTAPHWAKNLAFYGDPFYPLLHRWLPVRPWTPDSAARFASNDELWHPARNLAGLWETIKALYSFSFVPNDWPQFHGAVPVFGSLFTLSLIVLPFLRGTKRLWGLFAATHLGVVVWYSIHHQDRYLQAILPWMAACTAAVLILAWREGILPRLGVVLLVGLQLIWGSDVYFIPAHTMLNGSFIKPLVELLNAGYRKDYASPLNLFEPYGVIGRELRKTDTVLVHDEMVHLGLRVPTISDHPRYQMGISYGRQQSPREVYDLLTGLGVTQVMWRDVGGEDSLAGDLVFLDFVLNRASETRSVAGRKLTRMPATAPADVRFGEVAVLTCDKHYPPGLYHLQDLTLFPRDKNPAGFPTPFESVSDSALAPYQTSRVQFVVHDPKCHDAASAWLSSAFKSLGKRGSEQLWSRKHWPEVTSSGPP